MRALSIRQPWIYAILNFGKRCENRAWAPESGNLSVARRIVGSTILIHAAKGCTRDEFVSASDFMRVVGARRPWDGSTILPGLKSPELVRGAIVARAALASVVKTLPNGCRWELGGGVVQACALCGGHRFDQAPCPSADPWAIPGCVGLILADVSPLPEPITYAGARGFFEVPDAILNGGP